MVSILNDIVQGELQCCSDDEERLQQPAAAVQASIYTGAPHWGDIALSLSVATQTLYIVHCTVYSAAPFLWNSKFATLFVVLNNWLWIETSSAGI